MTEPQEIPPYSGFELVIFGLVWLLGLGVCLAYISALWFLMQYTKADLASVFSTKFSSAFTIWNILAIGMQCYLLVSSARSLLHREEPTSGLLFRVLMASIGVPFIATAGCLMLSSLAPRMAG